MDKGDIYEAELAVLSALLNIESEEKERAEGILGFLAWVNARKHAICSKKELGLWVMVGEKSHAELSL